MPKEEEKKQTTELATIPDQNSGKVLSVFSNPQEFEFGQRMALMLNKSDMVPSKYQGQENFGNCVIAVDLARLMKLPPLMVMRSLNVIRGNTGWAGKFVAAMINSSGYYSERLHYSFSGKENTDDWTCIAWTYDKETKERLDGPPVSIALAKAEGWYYQKDKQGNDIRTKWQTMPKIMLMYRAASFFGSVYCPELLNGLRSIEEEEDILIAHGTVINTTDVKPATLTATVLPASYKPSAGEEAKTAENADNGAPKKRGRPVGSKKTAESTPEAETVETPETPEIPVPQENDIPAAEAPKLKGPKLF